MATTAVTSRHLRAQASAVARALLHEVERAWWRVRESARLQTSLHSKLSLTLWRFDARTARFECLAAIPADESKPNYRFGTPSSAGAAHLDIVARRKDRALFLPRLAMSTRARDLVMDNVLGLDPRKPVFVLP
ncbi:MAG: hypothetical protein U0575_17495, partial [Phycisphaerales bacterium]